MCASVKRHEEAFGWLKTVGGLRKTKLIGREKLAGQALMCFATYNLGRIGGLSGWWDATSIRGPNSVQSSASTTRVHEESTMARDQSMRPAARSRARSSSSRRSHTPASCHAPIVILLERPASGSHASVSESSARRSTPHAATANSSAKS